MESLEKFKKKIDITRKGIIYSFTYSLFRTSRYLGQIIISLVVKEVKHSPFWLGEVDRSHR